MNTVNAKRQAKQLAEAKFEPRLKTYLLVFGSLILTVTIVGIVLIPFWIILGRIYLNKYFDNLYCQLTTRALHFKKGVLVRVERTVPLDKIQDLTFKEGPILRYFGLSFLKIETAGQSQAQGLSDLSLIGIIDSRNFRKMVLDQRDEITDKNYGTADNIQSTDSELLPVLKEIQKTLKSIESKISK